MVSVGLSDFIGILVALTGEGVEGDIAYGRCPDCGIPVEEPGVSALIGGLLGHELLGHQDYGDPFDGPRLAADPDQPCPHGDSPEW